MQKIDRIFFFGEKKLKKSQIVIQNEIIELNNYIKSMKKVKLKKLNIVFFIEMKS